MVIAWCYDCNCIVEVICAYRVDLQGYMLRGRLASEKLQMRETEPKSKQHVCWPRWPFVKGLPGDWCLYIATKYISDKYGSLSCL